MIYLPLLLLCVLITIILIKKKNDLFFLGILGAVIFSFIFIICMLEGINTTSKVAQAKETMETYLRHPYMIKTENVHHLMYVESRFNAVLKDAQFRKTNYISLIFGEGMFISKDVLTLEKFDGDIKN